MADKLQLEPYTELLRGNFLKYTRKAFQLIPKIASPVILDVGCGSGIQTLELASLTNGKIISIDINDTELAKLRERVVANKLTGRIEVINCSFLKMKFPKESFDIIWGEGIGGFISFEKSLKEWYRFIKPKGVLVLHEDSKKLSKHLKIGIDHNYEILGHFMLPDDAWWKEYYEPLEKQIKDLVSKYEKEPNKIKTLNKYQDEVNSFKKNPQTSGFIILQKKKRIHRG